MTDQQTPDAPDSPTPVKKTSHTRFIVTMCGIVALLAAGTTAIIATDDGSKSGDASLTRPFPTDDFDAPTEDSGPVAEPAPADTASDFDVTEAAMELTWAGTSEQQRDDLCLGIRAFGVDWAAKQLKGGGDSTLDEGVDMDWDQAARILETKCAER